MVACNYGPAGNIVTNAFFLANVRPLRDGALQPSPGRLCEGDRCDKSYTLRDP